MRRIGILAVGAATSMVLAGCADPSENHTKPEVTTEDAGAPSTEFGFMQAQEQGPSFRRGLTANESARAEAQGAVADARRALSDADQRSVSAQAPQIAYSYAVGFRVDADQLPIFQQAHVDLCESLGDDCRILSLAQSGTEEYGYGTLELQVVASKAADFSEQLRSSAEGVEAEQVSYGISGEDLTDNIIDTEARLDGRRVLRDRLMEVLRTRQGSVAEIVEAERGVAAVNEEIDAASSRLATMRTRVAFSNFNVEYSPEQGELRTGFWTPVSDAFASAGSIIGVVIAGIIYVLAAAIPILIVGLGLRWAWRRSEARWRQRDVEVE